VGAASLAAAQLCEVAAAAAEAAHGAAVETAAGGVVAAVELAPIQLRVAGTG
jgi:hypothetical protein